ncbi:MAG: hypothetical protein KBC06_00600 [Candidatus Pacebacteria bacterium]|nr:hypothetical protein [Candidatus Paceibacterota bacterium]
MIEPILIFIYKVLLALLPFAGTVLLAFITFKFWIHYVRQDFISGIEFVVLEVVPPREVLRSPKAMELFITNALYHFSVKGGKEELWQGAVWFWFSLEIASIDGQVHFFIRTPSRVKGLIETQMYAQYPQAQVKEVEDYTLAIDEISPTSSWMGWGCEFALEKHEAFPIKTYVDFGLDKDPKEEFKVDPISPVVELFASLKKGEQMWVQIVVTPSKKTFRTAGHWFRRHDWVEESKHEMFNMLKDYTAIKGKGVELGTDARVEIRPPDFLKRALEKMTTKVTKVGFDTGIRAMYIAKKEVYDLNSRRNLRLIFRQYAAPDVNGLKRINSTQGDAYGGIFSTPPDVVLKITDRMLTEYRERSFFHLPMRHTLLSDGIPLFWPISPFIFPGYKHPHTFVMNTEELATLWHFPGQILKVPTLERIESKEASPPTNLPT